jgi:hypothetical protein
MAVSDGHRTEASMSEFDNMKDKAEQYAQQHPEQIKKGEEAAERKFGLGQQEPEPQDQGKSGQGGPQDQGQQDQGQQDQQSGH